MCRLRRAAAPGCEGVPSMANTLGTPIPYYCPYLGIYALPYYRCVTGVTPIPYYPVCNRCKPPSRTTVRGNRCITPSRTTSVCPGVLPCRATWPCTPFPYCPSVPRRHTLASFPAAIPNVRIAVPMAPACRDAETRTCLAGTRWRQFHPSRYPKKGQKRALSRSK